MATEIKAPNFPESVAEGTVATWHKKPGDSVERDELLVEIETDKVVLEVVAPEAGTLSDVLVDEDETVESEQLLGKLDAGAAKGGSGKEESGKQEKADDEASGDTSSKAKGGDSKQAGTAKSGGKQHEVKAPSFPESVQEGTVASWNKQVGEAVKRDEVLAEIETDKVVLEVVAPADGALTEIKAEADSQVESEEVLALFTEGAGDADGGDEGRDDKASSAKTDTHGESDDSADENLGGKILAPAARKMVAENDLDVSRLEGTGKGGRILKEDVQKALKDGSAAKSGGEQKKADAAATAKAAPAPVEGQRPEKRVPMSRLRQTVAKRLVEAQQTAAMLTTYNEVDMSAIMALRAEYKERFQKAHDVKLGFMSFFVKAASEALKRFPDVNASIDGKEIVYHGYQDISVAVSTDRGLVVPVLRDTDQMQMADVEKTIGDFGKRARDGKLGIDEMQGGTFTITNGGIFGSLLSTPILNPPQTAILGMHKIQERPMAVDGQVEIRPMMYLAISYDHRMIDGKDAVQFLVAIKELLEDPARLLLNV
ncbi:2-oxoglutarate dehydrogenase complex dihydrolipoyllysine-residue succinyltransferase [Halomonas garicola]|uniref:2-oxoglutarate dehydrogenase complex dihydrolipoyllysine-residue succinyltransferase n=1 Tax=Halomonas garicola TaxID=1690008 RepID=UPI00289A8966|nr:2-oxoglutarate dehydrogenase complex dihydrolipoyllysine-residue succinyltransferase [Halomonas garicola]